MHKPLLATSFLLASSLPAQWVQQTPATSPAARDYFGMTYDIARANIILFGGNNPPFGRWGDTWTYDGTNWTAVTTANSPSGRTHLSLVNDLVRSEIVLYGGSDTGGPFGPGASSDETWIYNGTDWALQSPATSPGGLARYAAAFDAAQGAMVLYGGNANQTFPIANGDTWEWSGTDWTMIAGAGQPGPLEGAAMCFHRVMGRTIMFGGIDPQTGGVDTTWVYDGTAWSAVAVAGGSPSPRVDPQMVYDPARGVAVLSGGMNFTNGVPYTDTWEFDGSLWVQISDSQPGVKWNGLAMDEANDSVVLFGGTDNSFMTFADTWEFDRTVATYGTFGSGCLGSGGVPELVPQGVPSLNSTFQLDVTNLTGAGGLAYMVFGFSATTWNGMSLPLPLTPFGMPGCNGYVSVDAGSFIVNGGGGIASWMLTVPNDPTLAGIRFFNQAISFDPGAGNAANAVVSDAGVGRIY